MNYSNQQRISAPPLTQTNKIFIICSVVFFLLGTVIQQFWQLSAAQLLGLSWSGVMQFKVWQLVTYPCWNSGILSFVFSMLIVWMTGSELESYWGRKFYQKFVLSSLIGSGILFCIFSFILEKQLGIFAGSILVGTSGLTFSLLMSYALLFPDREFTFLFLFPMKAKYFCLLLGGIELYNMLFSPYGNAIWGHFLTVAWSFAFLKWHSHRSKKGGGGGDSQGRKKSKANLKLVNSDSFGLPKEESKENSNKYWH